MSQIRDIFEPAIFAPTRRPAMEASGLPGYCYTSPEWYEREIERIFMKEWLFVGRADQIPNVGDYMSLDIAGEPIIIVRDQSGQIRAFSASCRHRGTRILPPGQGTCKVFRCPYHSWTYSLQGELLGAPGMSRTKNFDRANYGLVPVRLDSWDGFLFVSFSDEGVSLHEFLGDLPARLANYRLSEMVCTRQVAYDLNCNWKVYVENAMEVLHVQMVHRKTIEETAPTDTWVSEEANGSYIMLYGKFAGSLALLKGDVGFPPIEGLGKKETDGSHIPLIYPNTMLGITCDCMWWLLILPEGPGRTKVLVGSCFPRKTVERPDFQEVVARYYTRWDTTVPEDNWISERQQEGLRARLNRRGRYSYQEDLVHAIANYVLGRVIDPV